jgi:hypothetical protein
MCYYQVLNVFSKMFPLTTHHFFIYFAQSCAFFLTYIFIYINVVCVIGPSVNTSFIFHIFNIEIF